MRLPARALVWALLVSLVAACGAGARQKTIRLTYEANNILLDELEQYTESQGKALVLKNKAAGVTQAENEIKLNAFLAAADKVHVSLMAVLRMVAAAAALDDDKSLAALLGVAALAKKQYEDFKEAFK